MNCCVREMTVETTHGMQPGVCDVNVNVNLYSASSQKNASNALNVPSTDQKNVFSVRRKQSICMSGSRKLFWNKFHVVAPATAKVRRPYVWS